MASRVHLFTIGHSTHPWDAFLKILVKHKISAIADVRSSPYSRFCPHFNKEPLATALKSNDIQYVFLGRELGARTDDLSCYVDGRVQYSCLAEKESFREGINRVKQGSIKHRVALMCSEKEPLECHRTVLVARVLADEGCEISHIHADMKLEAHADAMMRMLGLLGLSQEDLIYRNYTQERLMNEALSIQEQKIAYSLDDKKSVEPKDVP